jgi:hypothetical protein
MNTILKRLLLGCSFSVLLLGDVSPETPLGLGLVREANAIVGAPLTPISYAGVARRTTRRTVAVTSTAAATSAAAATTAAATTPPPQQPAPAPAQSAPPPAPAAAQPAGAPPVGTIVAALPPGCVSSAKGGVEYYNCAGVYYRPAFQGNNLVYVVQQP